MSVFLSKLLPLFVYPLGLACLLIAGALLLQRYKRIQNILTGAALVVIAVCGNRWTAASLARSLEWRFLPIDPAPRAEVIVVLGGATTSADYPRQSVEINGAGDRLLYAARLYGQGLADHILVSGGGLDWLPRRTSQAQEMADVLKFLGVPAEAIWLEPESRNTYENAVFTARLLQPQGIQRILLVASAMHMPRSVRLFEAQGFEVIPMPVDYAITQESWRLLWQADLRSQMLNLLPSAENLGLTTLAIKEYLGIFTYQLRGWK